MEFTLIRPQVRAQPTLESAIWFLQLRWVAVAGQLATLAVVALGLRIDLPAASLLALIGTTATTNLGYAGWLRHLRQTGLTTNDRLPTAQVISFLMLIDILVLTGMLYLSAGMANPFSLFYFVNIAIAAAILTPAWAWGIWLATVAGMIFLLLNNVPITALSVSSNLTASIEEVAWTLPRIGFLASFSTCSAVITYFITVLTGELRRREKALQDAEDARTRNRQLEALATLAAGAGHELASPLSTIAVIAKELNRGLTKLNVGDAIMRDVQLIRSELDRCRQILDRMTSAAGEAAGERLQNVPIESFLNECILGLREPERIRIEIGPAALESTALLPLQASAQAIRNLLQNAIDASQPGAVVTITANVAEAQWRIEVIDRGDGMTPEVLERIGEPFFTTKEPGKGMGLGLFLTQNLVQRLGGSLSIDSGLDVGTKTTVELPVARTNS